MDTRTNNVPAIRSSPNANWPLKNVSTFREMNNFLPRAVNHWRSRLLVNNLRPHKITDKILFAYLICSSRWSNKKTRITTTIGIKQKCRRQYNQSFEQIGLIVRLQLKEIDASRRATEAIESRWGCDRSKALQIILSKPGQLSMFELSTVCSHHTFLFFSIFTKQIKMC